MIKPTSYATFDSSNENGASSTRQSSSEVAQALRSCRRGIVGIALFSGTINILMLTGAFFMLQVYDRVLPSRSVSTLVGLALIAAVLFIAQGILDAIRMRLLAPTALPDDLVPMIRKDPPTAAEVLRNRRRVDRDMFTPWNFSWCDWVGRQVGTACLLEILKEFVARC